MCSVLDPAFAELVAIYTEALVPSERKSLERLQAMIEQPGYFFLVATESNAVAGFSIVRAFEDSDAALLEYIAVARPLRNRGVGQRLFEETASFSIIASRFLLIETESDKKPSADLSDRMRRKTFYRRLGCREVEQLAYIMPPVSSEAPPEMDMLVYKRELPLQVERTRLRQWLERSYVEVYGMSANDVRIDVMLRNLKSHVQLI